MKKSLTIITAIIMSLVTFGSYNITSFAAIKDYGGILFDAEYYAAHNQDVVAALGSTDENVLLEHYINIGSLEGRQPYDTNDPLAPPSQTPSGVTVYRCSLLRYVNTDGAMLYSDASLASVTGVTLPINTPITATGETLNGYWQVFFNNSYYYMVGGSLFNSIITEKEYDIYWTDTIPINTVLTSVDKKTSLMITSITCTAYNPYNGYIQFTASYQIIENSNKYSKYIHLNGICTDNYGNVLDTDYVLFDINATTGTFYFMIPNLNGYINVTLEPSS